MRETSVRLLRLLALLPAQPEWSGTALATRLGVTTRTVRADVERLRSLGYRVESRPGTAGGYRLAAGSALPPLLLDDEEAVAVAVGLRVAAAGTVTGIEETSLRALAKLEQTLPVRLRHRVDLLREVVTPATRGGPTVDTGTLTAIATATRQREQLRFDYLDHEGRTSARTVEPHQLVYTGHRWYLLAWDPGREDWRTFRADRIRPRIPNGPRFRPRQPPAGGAAAHVLRGTGSQAWPCPARVTMLAPLERVAAMLTPAAGLLEPVDARRCRLVTGGESWHQLAGFLGSLPVDFVVDDPPALREHLRDLASRYARAATTAR